MLKKSVTHLFIVSVAAVISFDSMWLIKGRQARHEATSRPRSCQGVQIRNHRHGLPQSQALLSAAHEWLGVPYRYGESNDRKGHRLLGTGIAGQHKTHSAIKLPRNSREQHDYCTAIAKGKPHARTLYSSPQVKTKRVVTRGHIYRRQPHDHMHHHPRGNTPVTSIHNITPAPMPASGT